MQDAHVELANFKALVKKMLEAQRDYFSTRSPDKLRISKAIEKQVRDYVDPPKPQYKTLFDEAL